MIYDGLNGKFGSGTQSVLQDMYDLISINDRLHPDDDFEQIIDRMMDQLEADYGNQGVAEETTDVYRKVFKKNGKPVGEVGIDLEASPGNGDWYVKHYASGTDYSGYDTRQDAIDELKYMVSQGLDEHGVAEGEYDDPRWEPREPDMSRKVDWDIEAERNAPEEPEAAKTVTVTDNNDKVVLTFPSTGGFNGDLRYATSKGFDTDSGDYHLSWKRDTNEGNNWLDTPVSEEFDRIKKLAGLK